MGHVLTLAEYNKMQQDEHLPDWHMQVLDKLNAHSAELKSISERVGKESEDGLGGTGLYGRCVRMEADVKSLLQDRNFLRGAAALFIALSVFVISNIKTWALSLFPHGGH